MCIYREESSHCILIKNIRFNRPEMDRSEMEEASMPLSFESFSYRWLVDTKPSAGSRGGSFRASLDEGSFIEMDPRSPPSKRFVSRIGSSSQDFKFDFPVSQCLDNLVPADELFAEGFVLPLFVDSSSMKAYEYSDSEPRLSSAVRAVPKGKPQPDYSSTRKRNRRFFCKYLDFLRLMYRVVVRHGTRRGQVTRHSVYPANDSPKTSCSYSADEWRHSVDSESSIYEAVLHCKRSIGK